MSAVVVTAVFVSVEGRKADLIDALRLSLPAVHDEAGCELYALHDQGDGTVVMIEKWTSRADLDRHMRGNAAARLMDRIRELLARPVMVTRMDPISAGTAAQGVL